MKIFLSWSGGRSKAIATALNELIPQIILSAEPWMSPDIEKGKQWSREISDKLEECHVGVICLTKENLTSSWLCFEAGALSKTKNAYVCTFLLDIKPSDVQPPLGTFQHTLFTKEDVRKLLRTINIAVAEHGGKALPSDVLDKIFDKWWWTDIETTLNDIAKQEPPSKTTSSRPTREVMFEVLDIVRSLQRTGVVDESGAYRKNEVDDIKWGNLSDETLSYRWSQLYSYILESLSPQMARLFKGAMYESKNSNSLTIRVPVWIVPTDAIKLDLEGILSNLIDFPCHVSFTRKGDDIPKPDNQ